MAVRQRLTPGGQIVSIPAPKSSNQEPAGVAEPEVRPRGCVLMMVPIPWQGFRQAIAEHGEATSRPWQVQASQPGHRQYRTLYP